MRRMETSRITQQAKYDTQRTPYLSSTLWSTLAEISSRGLPKPSKTGEPADMLRSSSDELSRNRREHNTEQHTERANCLSVSSALCESSDGECTGGRAVDVHFWGFDKIAEKTREFFLTAT